MRQFILGGNVAGLTSGTVQSKTDADAGKIGVGYFPNGVATFDTGANIKDKGFIVLMRAAKDGGPVFLPLYKNHFSYEDFVNVCHNTPHFSNVIKYSLIFLGSGL